MSNQDNIYLVALSWALISVIGSILLMKFIIEIAADGIKDFSVYVLNYLILKA